MSVDLKGIPIYAPHRKHILYSLLCRESEYRVLPFGLSLSLRVFVRCMEEVIALLRQQGTRLTTYLDDWLLLVQLEQE